MANEEHLALLRQGVHAWNEWREQNPNIRADLSGAEFGRADLIGADLSQADLTGANFGGAFLVEAKLRRTDGSVALSGAL